MSKKYKTKKNKVCSLELELCFKIKLKSQENFVNIIAKIIDIIITNLLI